MELILVSFRHATAAVLGAALPDETLMRNVGQPLIAQFKDMAPDHADELLAVYREFNHAHHDELAKEYPGVHAALDAVGSRGLPMGVVTSKGTYAAGLGMDRFDLRKYMDVVVTADDVETHKPDPHPLRFAADRMGVPLGYCMYVGDSPHDMMAAVAGGAISVAALWGAFSRAQVVVPGTRFALEDISQVPMLLDGDTGRFAVGA